MKKPFLVLTLVSSSVLSLTPLVPTTSEAETEDTQEQDGSAKAQLVNLSQPIGSKDRSSNSASAISNQGATATTTAPLIETHVGNTHVTLVSDNSVHGLVLMVDSPHLKSQGKSFYLKEPSRLVVDLPGDSWEHLSETLPVSQSSLIQRVRIGTHPDKLRIVMDLSVDNPLPTSPSIDGTNFRLALNTSGTLKGDETTSRIARARLAAAAGKEGIAPNGVKPAAEMETATERNQSATAGQDSPDSRQMELAKLAESKQAKSADSGMSPGNMEPEKPRPDESLIEKSGGKGLGPDIDSHQPRIEGLSESEIAKLSSKSDRRPSETGTQSSLWGITFVSLAPSMTRAIRLDLSVHPEFSLLRKDDTTFTLKIPRVALKDPSLALPFFPPREFIGLTVVLAREANEGVELTIGVDKGVDLVAAPKEKSIWVKAIKSPSS